MKNKVLTPGLADSMVRVTELAAIAASAEVGRGEEKRGDAAAVDGMRSALNEVDFKGRVVIDTVGISTIISITISIHTTFAGCFGRQVITPASAAEPRQVGQHRVAGGQGSRKSIIEYFGE